MENRDRRTRERLGRPSRLLIGLLLVAGSAGAAGCSTHRVAVTHPCPVVSKGKVVVAPNRGAVGMAKIGLTQKSLKAQQKCDQS